MVLNSSKVAAILFKFSMISTPVKNIPPHPKSVNPQDDKAYLFVSSYLVLVLSKLLCRF